MLIIAYFKCGEGIQGPTNATLWADLLAFVTSLQKQVIIMGDFNVAPEVFMTTTMAQHMQVQILATGEETCNTGNELDWALVSTPLAADLKVEANWMVPFKPHAMLQFRLAGHFDEIAVQQLAKFGPAPKLQSPVVTWHQVDPQDTTVKWLDHITDPLTKQAGTIYHRIERYVLHQLEEPHGGRGLTLQFVQRPLHDVSKPWLWKRGSMAFWNQLQLRLQQLLHYVGGEPRHQAQLQKLGWKIQEHWHAEAIVSLQGFQSLFEMLRYQHGDEHIHVLLNYAQQQRELHQAETFQRETEEYRQWFTTASQSGCRGLYRTLKRDEMPYLRPFQDQPRALRMPMRVEQWGEIWKVQTQQILIPCMEQLISKG